MVRYRGGYGGVRRSYRGPKLVDEIALIVRGGWLPRSCAVSRSSFVVWAVSCYTFGAAKKSVKALRNVLACVNIFVTTSQDTHSRTLHRALVERCRPRSAKGMLRLFVVPRDTDMPQCWDGTDESPAPETLAGSNPPRPAPWKDQARPLTESGPPVGVADKIVAIQLHRVRLGLGPGDIGVFSEHGGSTGIAFLTGADSHRPSIAQVQGMLASVGGQVGASFTVGTSPLTKAELARLKATADTAFEEQHVRHPFTGDLDDYKLALDRSQLEQIVGVAQVKRLLALFGSSPPTDILLRRCHAHGKCIRFHTDHSLKTLQVSLTDDDTYSGGKLVYLTDSGLHCPQRVAGTFTLHRRDVVHGVSRLRSGTRYGLFFLKRGEGSLSTTPLCGSL